MFTSRLSKSILACFISTAALFAPEELLVPSRPDTPVPVQTQQEALLQECHEMANLAVERMFLLLFLGKIRQTNLDFNPSCDLRSGIDTISDEIVRMKSILYPKNELRPKNYRQMSVCIHKAYRVAYHAVFSYLFQRFIPTNIDGQLPYMVFINHAWNSCRHIIGQIEGDSFFKDAAAQAIIIKEEWLW